MEPRKPNDTELAQLTSYIAEQLGGMDTNDNLNTAKELVSTASIAVFDNYITDCVGYAGKIMSVVWSASPSFYETFVWSKDNKVIDHINQDIEFQIKEEDLVH